MTPEEKAAHLARLEYMQEMGLGHWSITNPEVCVRMFRKIVQREERERCAKVVAELAAKWILSEPGESSPETWPNLIRDSK